MGIDMNNHTKFKRWLDTQTGAKEAPKKVYSEDDMKTAWFNGYSTRNVEMRELIDVEAEKHNSFLSELAVANTINRMAAASGDQEC